jgi:predicted ATPase/DNA-binding transcriptional LysR family regulator
MDVEPRLRAFAAVAREGSFSQAAARLYVSQPAISKHVASLEAELGAQLVDRGRRGARLTPAGELLADYVLRAEALLASARRALEAGGDAETGTLALAASGIPGTYLLPPVVSRFHEDHPGVELRFEVSTSAGALELVRAHRVELAVVGGLEIPPELEGEPLVEDEVVLIGPPAFGGRRLRAPDLEDQTWIFREEGSATRAAVEAARWQIGLRTVRTLELPSWESVKLAVAAGAGIAAISRSALGLELDTGTVAVLDVRRWRLLRTISIVRARDVPLTPPAERFLERLREAFQPAPSEALANTNLPLPPSPLIGRREEVRDLTELVRTTRLVTLTGPGGSGKTRLAAEVAGRLADEFPDGVYFVDLAPLRDVDHVLPTVAQMLEVVPPERLLDALAGRRTLLVLDNFEHLLDGAATVAEILRAASDVRVLATSRMVLGLRAEHAYEVAPLTLPDAAALFVARARAVAPGFQREPIVEEICRRLDRLPLAIELAAARIRVLSAAELHDRLGHRLPVLTGGPADAEERQRTLRATIEWSYDLLTAEEQTAFTRLSVFRGGCTVAAAEEVTGANLDTITSLVGKSLLLRDPAREEPRLAMLETLREYALERFEELPDAAPIRARHAEHMLEFARRARGFARGPDAVEWLDRTQAELENIRAVLEWTIEAGEGELGLTLAEALEPYWYRGSQLREGLRWLEPLLERAPDAPPAVRGAALAVAGRLASELDQPERARAWYEAGLPLARAAGDRVTEAWVLHGLGYVSALEGDRGAARDLLEESHRLFLDLGQHAPAAGRLTYLAYLARLDGDLDAARIALERSIELYGDAGDAAGVAGSILELGDVALEERDWAGALERYREALGCYTDSRDVMYLFAGIAAVAGATGRRREAALLWGAAEQQESELDQGIEQHQRARYESVLGEIDPVEVAAGRAASSEDALALAGEVAEAPVVT